MNELVPHQKNQVTARSAAQRQRLRDLAHRIAWGDGGPHELIALANRAAEIVKKLPFVPSTDLCEIIPAIEAALQTYKDYNLIAAPATMADIVREITELLLGIPGTAHVDLAILTECAIEAVAREKPSLALLLVARERLLLSCEFRPSVAKIVQALSFNTEDFEECWMAQSLRSVAAMGALAGNYARLLEALPHVERAEQVSACRDARVQYRRISESRDDLSG
jgi:hypothetical protein